MNKIAGRQLLQSASSIRNLAVPPVPGYLTLGKGPHLEDQSGQQFLVPVCHVNCLETWFGKDQQCG